jgi:hypothetical protein
MVGLLCAHFNRFRYYKLYRVDHNLYQVPSNSRENYRITSKLFPFLYEMLYAACNMLRCLGVEQMCVSASGLSTAGLPFYFLSPSLAVQSDHHRTTRLQRVLSAADCLVIFIKVCFEQVSTTHVQIIIG